MLVRVYLGAVLGLAMLLRNGWSNGWKIGFTGPMPRSQRCQLRLAKGILETQPPDTLFANSECVQGALHCIMRLIKQLRADANLQLSLS